MMPPDDIEKGRRATDPIPEASARQTNTTIVSQFDWRAAARATEQAGDLEPIDHALTATGLAAELLELGGRIGGAS